MVFLIILGVLALLIALIMILPIGFDIGYEHGKIHVSAKAAGVQIKLFPRRKKPDTGEPKPPKKKKEKKPKQPKEPKEEKPKEKKRLDITLEEILDLLRAVLDGIAYFSDRMRVDRFVLHLTVAGYDPYNVAMAYGKINAWLSGVAPLCKKLNARNSDVWTAVDFIDDWPHVDFAIAMSFRIGTLFAMGIRTGVGALKVLLRRRKRIKREAKAAALGQPAELTENTEQTIQEEERKAANG